jgi:4-hydroxybenzoate polyprenyltransferase
VRDLHPSDAQAEAIPVDRMTAVTLERKIFPEATGPLPLCVDLDGTLTPADTLMESLIAPRSIAQLARALLALPFTGRAAFKARIAANTALDVRLLPYNLSLLRYLETQKRSGRHLTLATAADRAIANAVAGHIGLFDEIIASDGTCNLKGRTKAAALRLRFGNEGFSYAGNDASDVAIWEASGGAILVNTPPGLARRVGRTIPVEETFPHRAAPWSALLRAMRPHQWVKSLLVFIPIFTAHALGDIAAWINAMLVFAAFCATASSIYLVNDAADIAADRRHPRKRHRPFASGAMPLATGLTMAGFLAVLGAGLAAASGTLAVIATYAALSVAYSLKLKQMPLVDVFLLGALYTIRLFGGGVATGHDLSLWLLAFSGFLFLGLALLKRVAELGATQQSSGQSGGRRGYMAGDLPVLQMLGCAASFASSMVLALFVQREATAAQYASRGLLWGIVPVMLFWQCRLWLSTARGYMHDDPIIYSARDWVSWIVGGTVLLLLLLAYSLPL